MSIYEFLTRVQRLQLDNVHNINSKVAIEGNTIIVTFTNKENTVTKTSKLNLNNKEWFIGDVYSEISHNLNYIKYETD